MTHARDRRQELWAVSRQELLDGVRGRRQLVVRSLTPIVLFAVVLGASLSTRGLDPVRTTPYRVAVEGDLKGAANTVKALTSIHLAFETTTDAPLAAATGADIALRLPDRLDDRVAAHEPVTIILYQTAISPPSRSASAWLRAGLGDIYKRQIVEAAPADASRPELAILQPLQIDVQITQTGTRELSAQLVPALLVLQAAMLVNGTATRILGRRNRGLLMAQLLLPLHRNDLARAKAIAELVLGLVGSAPVLLVVLGYTAVSGWRRGGVGVAAAATLAALTATLVLSLLMVATGLFIGSAAKSQEQVTLGTAASLILTAVVAAVVALGEFRRGPGLAVVPVAGLVSALRDVLNGIGSPVWLAVGVASTVVLAATLTRAAGRAFDADRIVLRVA